MKITSSWIAALSLFLWSAPSFATLTPDEVMINLSESDLAAELLQPPMPPRPPHPPAPHPHPPGPPPHPHPPGPPPHPHPPGPPPPHPYPPTPIRWMYQCTSEDRFGTTYSARGYDAYRVQQDVHNYCVYQSSGPCADLGCRRY